jgi:hypothetical protein
MVKVFHNREEQKERIEEKQSEIKEQSIPLLKKLKKEEAALVEEKKNLVSLQNKLRYKTREEIKNSKNNIETLKQEILELKTQCEELQKSLQTIQ